MRTPTRAPRRRSALAWQFGRFAVVGASNTVLSFGVYAALLAAGIPYLAAAGVAFAAGAANGYALNRLWTFRAGPASARQVASYLAVQVVGLAVTLGTNGALVHAGHVAKLGAQALAAPLATVVMFWLNRTWTFAGSGLAPRST